MVEGAPVPENAPAIAPLAPMTVARLASLTLLVVVPDGANPEPWVRALGAAPDAECSVILAYPGDAPAPNFDRGPEVVHSSHGSSIFHLWEAAIGRASGTYLAMVDARCPPAVTWLDGARRAMADGVPAFFGPVTMTQSDDGQALVEYLLEYGQFARPIGTGMDEVPGNNLVFRRDILRTVDLRGHQFHKVFFVDRLKQEGRVPVYRDEVEVVYEKRYRRFHYLRRRFAHGRTYAALRAAGRGTVFGLLRALSSPVLPLLRLVRIANSLRGKPSLQAGLWRHPAYALAAETAWSLGECAGYLTGKPGDPAYLN